MKKRALILLILLLTATIPAIAQPGWVTKVTGNLNDIDSVQIRKCIDNDLCWFGSILIDSTTDLSRLSHLNVSSAMINLEVKLKAFPPSVATLSLDKIEYLSITGSSLEDLSYLPKMDNLTGISVSRFQGRDLSFAHNLPKLRHIEVSNSNQIINLEQCFQNRTIENLIIRSCKNIDLKKNALYQLKRLVITGSQAPDFEWKDVANFQQLEQLTLPAAHITSLPDNFPKTLQKIHIKNGTASLNALNKLYELETIKTLELNNIELKWNR